MLATPQLQTMSLDDLNTRYANTFIRYNDKVRWLQQFCRYTGNRTLMSFYDTGLYEYKDPETMELFDAYLLDTRRFPSMWVVDKDTFFFVQSNVSPFSRYSRGIMDDTYHFWNINFGGMRYPSKIKILEACYKAMDKWEAQTFEPARADDFMFPKANETKLHVPMRNVLLIKDGVDPVQIYLQTKSVQYGTPLYLRIENECIQR